MNLWKNLWYYGDCCHPTKATSQIKRKKEINQALFKLSWTVYDHFLMLGAVLKPVLEKGTYNKFLLQFLLFFFLTETIFY